MLHDRPEAKTALIGYLQQLRVNATPGPIQPRLAAIYPALTDALTKHLSQLDLAASPERAQIPQRVQ